MSGGAMDYAFSRIHEATEQVKDYLSEVEKRPLTDFEFDAKRMDMEPDYLKRRVVATLRKAAQGMRDAEIYARRVEWLMSDDDGYPEFVQRTKEELAKTEEEFAGTEESCRQGWGAKDEDMLKSALWHVSNSVTNGKSHDSKNDITEWLKGLRLRIGSDSTSVVGEEGHDGL